MPTIKKPVSKPAPKKVVFSLGKPEGKGYQILKDGKKINAFTIDKAHAKELIALKNKIANKKK